MKRASSQKIDKFFLPAAKKSQHVAVEGTEQATSSAVVPTLQLDEKYPNTCILFRSAPCSASLPLLGECSPISSPCDQTTEFESERLDVASPSISAEFSSDIGKFVGGKVNDYTKRRLLETHWCPPDNYSFPYSLHRKNGKNEKRYVSQSRLNKFKWLVLSDYSRGLYCKYCVLFVTGAVGGYH